MPNKEAKFLNQLKQAAFQCRDRAGPDGKSTNAKWKENLEWFKGEQMLKKASWKSNTVTNFLFSQVMTIVPILANRIPEVTIEPVTQQDESKREAQVLTTLINRILRRNEFVLRQAELVTNGMLFGKGFWKVTWDGSANRNLGDFRIETPDTRSIFLEPGKMGIRESNYIFETRNIDKLSLYGMYPEKKKLIDKLFRKGEPAREDPGVMGKNTGEVGYHAAAPGETALTTSEAYVWDVAQRAPQDKPHIELAEAWFYDESTFLNAQEIDKKGKAAGITVGSPKYPRGRLIVFSGDEKLDDRPNPFSQFPYVEYQNYYIPGEQWGMGELEQAKPLQQMYNIRQNQIYDMLNLNLAPIVFYDHTAGIDPTVIDNRPNQYVPIQNVNGIKRMDPPRIPSEAFQSSIMLQKAIETIFGVREVTQGTVPGEIKSGFAIEQLQEAAQGRLRLKTRFIETAIKDLARYLTAMIGLFYEPGVHYHDNIDLTGATPDMFDYEIKAGVNLPGSRLAEQQYHQWMFANGIVDEEFIIDHAQIQGKDELKARMKPFWDARRTQMQEPQGGGQLQ